MRNKTKALPKLVQGEEGETEEETYLKYVINVYGGEFTFNFADGSKMIVQQGKPSEPPRPPGT